MRKFKNFAKNFILILIGLSIGLLTAEVLLKVFKPINFRVKGYKIVLPCNEKYGIVNYV